MFGHTICDCLQIIGISKADLAGYIGCDRSYVTALCSARRVPVRGGAASAKVVNALVAAAAANGKTEELMRFSECRRITDLPDALSARLYENETAKPARTAAGDASPNIVFGHRLDATMKLTGLTNVRFGKMLNIDPSYVSRFRSGKRYPISNPVTTRGIAYTLFGRICEKKLTKEAALLMNVSEEVFRDRERAFGIFYSWLFNIESDRSSVMEEIADRIGSMKGEITPPALSFDEVCAPACDGREVYFGDKGLQDAAARFLSYAVKQKAEEIFLFSEQNIRWMTSDPAFAARWYALMYYCVASGIRITIVHNMHRRAEEMSEAIKAWMPLYLSGMVFSFYCKAPPGERFSTTLLLIPGKVCVFGVNVKSGNPDDGIYRFDFDRQILKIRDNTANKLLERSGQLAHVYMTDDLYRLSTGGATSFTELGNKLLLATMPEKLLYRMLDRANASEAQRAWAIQVYKKYHTLLFRDLRNNTASEIVSLPDPGTVARGLAPADIPGVGIYYEPDEFRLHFQNVLSIMNDQPNFRFYVYKKPSFEDFRILCTRKATSVSRTKEPYVSIMFEHPEICRSFELYLEEVKKQCVSGIAQIEKLASAYDP